MGGARGGAGGGRRGLLGREHGRELRGLAGGGRRGRLLLEDDYSDDREDYSDDDYGAGPVETRPPPVTDDGDGIDDKEAGEHGRELRGLAGGGRRGRLLLEDDYSDDREDYSDDDYGAGSGETRPPPVTDDGDGIDDKDAGEHGRELRGLAGGVRRGRLLLEDDYSDDREDYSDDDYGAGSGETRPPAVTDDGDGIDDKDAGEHGRELRGFSDALG